MEKKKVKERQHARGPKVADASRKIPRHMKTGYRKVNEQITPAAEQYDSPSDYATQKSEQYTYDTAVIAYSGTKKAVRKVKDKIEEKIRDKAEDLEKRWERKEAERMEHEQPQRYDTQQMPANSSPAHAQSRPDISGHEVAPKQKTEVLQQRFNQPKPKQADTNPSQPTDPVRREFTVQERQRFCRSSGPIFISPISLLIRPRKTRHIKEATNMLPIRRQGRRHSLTVTDRYSVPNSVRHIKARLQARSLFHRSNKARKEPLKPPRKQ